MALISRASPSVIYLTFLLFILILPTDISADSVEVHFSVNKILLEDTLMSSLPLNAKWSFSAIDLSTGEKLIDTGNARDNPLIPGSIVKLFVTAAIMDMNTKEKIELDTKVAFDGRISEGGLQGDLYIKGSGNAFLSEGDIRKVVEEVLSKGVKEIRGDIIVDDSFFDTNGWVNRYYGPAYSTPSALGLDMHTVSIMVSGNPTNIKIDPPNEAVRISFNPYGKPAIRRIDDLTYEVSGFTSDSTLLRKRFPLKDPGLYAGGTLKTFLKENGVNVTGSVRKGKMPPQAKEVFRIKSKDLSAIIKDTNWNSLNVVAENLLLLLGATRFGEPGTIENGLNAIEIFLNDFDLQGIKIADGSGVSSDNKITSEQMVSFLKRVTKKPWFRSFYESLPRVGMDGTLKDIGFKNGQIRAKTGQLDDVYCLVGYIGKNSKAKIAFSYMVNVPGADLLREEGKKVFAFLEQLLD